MIGYRTPSHLEWRRGDSLSELLRCSRGRKRRMEGVPVRWLGKCAGRLSYNARIQRIVSAFNPSRQACRPFEVALGSSEIPAAQCAPCGGALLFSCVLGVCIAMLRFVRLFCRILPLPIIQSLARDT